MRGNIKVNGIEMTPAQLVELYLKTRNNLEEMQRLYEEKRKEVHELETELRVKEDLFKIKNAISNEPTEEISARPSIEWYENRYQSDCIKINQLHTTIDVLIDKLARLRGQMGLC